MVGTRSGAKAGIVTKPIQKSKAPRKASKGVRQAVEAARSSEHLSEEEAVSIPASPVSPRRSPRAAVAAALRRSPRDHGAPKCDDWMELKLNRICDLTERNAENVQRMLRDNAIRLDTAYKPVQAWAKPLASVLGAVRAASAFSDDSSEPTKVVAAALKSVRLADEHGGYPEMVAELLRLLTDPATASAADTTLLATAKAAAPQPAAFGKTTCYACGGEGHYACDCPSGAYIHGRSHHHGYGDRAEPSSRY